MSDHSPSTKRVWRRLEGSATRTSVPELRATPPTVSPSILFYCWPSLGTRIMHILLPSSVPHLNASPLCNSAASVHFSGAVLAGAALPRFSCYSSVRAPPLYPARTTSVLRPPQRWGYSAPDLFMAIGGAYGGLPEGSASSGRKEQLPPPTNCCEDVPNSVDYDGKVWF